MDVLGCVAPIPAENRDVADSTARPGALSGSATRGGFGASRVKSTRPGRCRLRSATPRGPETEPRTKAASYHTQEFPIRLSMVMLSLITVIEAESVTR
jgi:hypothetical protein